MNQRGYLLIEVLIASALISMAGSGLYLGLMQGVKTDQFIRKSSNVYDPLMYAQMRVEKDLKNSTNLSSHHFIGHKDTMSFPVLVTERFKEDKRKHKLIWVQYQIQNRNLIRCEQELTANLIQTPIQNKVVLKQVKNISILYTYLDENEKVTFEDFWIEEPYFGIPRGIKIIIQTENSPKVSKLVSLPQGKFGHLQVKETTEIHHVN